MLDEALGWVDEALIDSFDTRTNGRTTCAKCMKEEVCEQGYIEHIEHYCLRCARSAYGPFGSEGGTLADTRRVGGSHTAVASWLREQVVL